MCFWYWLLLLHGAASKGPSEREYVVLKHYAVLKHELSLEDSSCDCGGPWAEFRKLFNFTLGNSPLGSGPFGISSGPVEVLCYNTALPLARTVLQSIMHADGALKYDNLHAMTSSRYMDFGEYWCPSGLVSALALCAVVRAHSAREAMNQVKPEVIPTIDPDEEVSGTMNWAQALGAWPELVPIGCERHASCLAHVDLILALTTVRYCTLCLAEWFFSMEEISDNAIRWLRWLWHRGAYTVPPNWKGPSAAVRVRPVPRFKAAGAFAGPELGAPKDGTGATALLRNLAAAWGPQQFKSMSVRQKHFERIFGGLGDLPLIKGRGTRGVKVKTHPQDFQGRRSQLRFYVYDLPVVNKMLEQLHGQIREKELNPSVCNLGLSPCTETHTAKGTFNSMRPFVAEATFLAKLLAGPDEIFVEDPAAATYFVVPFFSALWCKVTAPFCWVRCSSQRPLNALLPFLTFYNASTAHRHLFLASDSVGDLSQDLQMQPLVLNYGPSPCNKDGSTFGPLITPPTITDDLPTLGRWDFTSKDLLLFMADGISGRPFRTEVFKELERWQHRLPHLFAVSKRDGANHGEGCADGKTPSLPAEVLWAEEMRRALFCPVMPGDNSFRMRLFHAVLVGCIPVVILFPGGSWYRNHGPPVNLSMPFPGRIPWSQMSIELLFDPEKETISAWAKQLVPELLRANIHELYQKQQLLAKAAGLLRFDFHGSQPDAFTALMDELADRPRQPPEYIECFDPRERFQTERCLSGTEDLAREEVEIYGVIACCPRWTPRLPEDTKPRSTQVNETCNILDADGVCISFGPTDGSTESSGKPAATQSSNPQRRANLKAHLEAIFVHRTRFEEVLEEDQDCMK